MNAPSGRDFQSEMIARHAASRLVAHRPQRDERVARKLLVQQIGARGLAPWAYRLFHQLPENSCPEIFRHKNHIDRGALADGQLPRAAESSSNWREALTWMLDLPRFFSAGTVSAARMPIPPSAREDNR